MITPSLFLLVMPLSIIAEDLAAAIENYKSVESYKIALRSKSSDSSEVKSLHSHSHLAALWAGASSQAVP